MAPSALDWAERRGACSASAAVVDGEDAAVRLLLALGWTEARGVELVVAGKGESSRRFLEV